MSVSENNKSALPFHIFLIYTFILFGRPQDYLHFLQPFRIALIFSFLSLITTLAGKKDIAWTGFTKIGVCKRYIVLFILMIVGIPFADHRKLAFNFVFHGYLVNIIYFFIFLLQVDSFRKIKSLIFTLTVSALFYGSLGLMQGPLSTNPFASGSMYDPNDLALFLVSLSPLGLFFFRKEESFAMKLIVTAAVVVSILTILISGSRGGLLSLATVFFLFFFTRLGSFKRSLKVGTFALVCLILMLHNEPLRSEKFSSFFNLEKDYNFTSETGRIEVWKTAFKLISANPLTGVGVSCFPRAFGYAREAEGRTPTWKAAHNAYIQIWTEIGYPGIIVFVAMIVGCLKIFLGFRRNAGPTEEAKDLHMLSGLILIGLWGHLVGVFFLSQAYSILFTLFFALSTVMLHLFPGANEVLKRPGGRRRRVRST